MTRRLSNCTYVRSIAVAVVDDTLYGFGSTLCLHFLREIVVVSVYNLNFQERQEHREA